MHFYCGCGNRISDVADRLPYKAYFLADEDDGRYADAMEAAIRDESLPIDKRVDEVVIHLQVRYLSRCIFQCPECGRLWVDDNDNRLHSFLPEGPVDKQLLAASREDD